MSSIGIIELGTENHYIYVYTLAKIFVHQKYKVYIFTTNKIAEQLKRNGLLGENIILKGEVESAARYFVRILIKFKCDNYIFATAESIEIKRLLLFSLVCKISLSIHNVNYWFENDKKRIEIFLRNILLKKITSINVGSENLKNEIISKYKFRKNVNVIPFNIYVPNNNNIKIDPYKIKICIPGMVEIKRRDYELLFRVLEDIDIDIVKERLEIYLLGKADLSKLGNGTQEIIEKCNKLIEKGFKIKYYTKFVDSEEYNYILYSCNIILGIVNIKTNFGGNEEVYGITKDTGLNYAMIQAGKPGIFPCNFNTFDELEQTTLRFGCEEQLKQILINLAKDKYNLKDLDDKSKKSAIKFTTKYINQQIVLN